MWWLVQVPDDAVTVDEEKGTLRVSLKNVPLVDQFSFPNGAGNNLGTAGVPATVSFDVTYTKVPGTRRTVQATSADPLSPFDWAGEMWMATNSGTFSVAYSDGSFSASGSFDSARNFGEMGTERNGSFIRRQDRAEGGRLAAAALPPAALTTASAATAKSPAQPTTSPKFEGRIPTESLIH